MIRAIGYVRRSTDRQGESLEQQRHQLESFAKKQGWTLAAVYADDAVSGSELRRPGLDELILAAADSSVGVILTWDRNRLTRPKDAVDGLLLERQFKKLGKRVVFASTGQELNDSFSSGLISFVEHYQNGDYLRKLSRDTMRGLVGRARAGMWTGGPIPFGYDRLILDDGTPHRIVRDMPDGSQSIISPDSGLVVEMLPKGRSFKKQDHEQCTLIPSDDARAAAVQRMFADCVQGRPTRFLRDTLDDAGFRTSRGRRFTVQTILPMLSSPAYIGKCVYNRRTFSKWHRYSDGSSRERLDEGFELRPEQDWVVRDNAWPALVDEETFNAVQSRRLIRTTAYRGNAMKSEYLLSGMAFCGICGGKLTGTTRTSGKGYKTRYYTCSRYSAGHKNECPKRYTVPADLVEDHIVGLIKHDLLKYRDDEKLYRYVEEALSRLSEGNAGVAERLKARAVELDESLARLREHLASMDATTAQSLGLYEQARTLAAERTKVVEDLVRASIEQGTTPVADDVRAEVSKEFDALEMVLAGGSLEEKRELIAAYVHRVEAAPERQTLAISLFPDRVSQMVAGVGFEPTTFGL